MDLQTEKISAAQVIKSSFVSGIRKGISSSIKILLIMIPISFVTSILNQFGIISYLVKFLLPVSKILGLQGETFIAFFTGIFVNCYSAIAIIITTPMPHKELIIISLMVLFSHTLPIELPIQVKAGANFKKVLFTRIFASVFIAILLNRVLPTDSNILFTFHFTTIEKNLLFSEIILTWINSSVTSIIKIVIIVNVFTIILQLLEKINIIKTISSKLYPLMKVLGLSEKVTVYWLFINMFGVIYGSTIILNQDLKSKLTIQENNAFHISIATCHGLIQETIIFSVIGVPVLWLVLPRILFSLVSVWAYNLFVSEPKIT